MRKLSYMERITGYPNPFETYLLVAGAAQGLLVGLGVARPASLEAALQGVPWLRYVWAVLIGLGAVTSLIGLYWTGNDFTGTEIKRAGLISVGFGGLIYGIAALFAGPAGVAAGVSTCAFGLAAFARFWQVTRLLRLARQEAVARVLGSLS